MSFDQVEDAHRDIIRAGARAVLGELAGASVLSALPNDLLLVLEVFRRDTFEDGRGRLSHPSPGAAPGTR